MTKTTIISSPAEFGAGTRGSSIGFEALMIQAEQEYRRSITNTRLINLKTPDYTFKAPSGDFFAKNVERVSKVLNNLSEAIKTTLLSEDFGNKPLLVFSGDHSNAAGTIMGIHEAYPSKRIGVVWIDAHADLHTPKTSPSGNMHGMPLGMLLKHETEIQGKRKLEEKEQSLWNELNQEVINPEDLVFIALRDTEWQEDKIISDNNIMVIRTPEVDILGELEVIRRSEEQLKNCDILYITFDIDSLDSSHVPGTGTPVNNGLNISQAEKLLAGFTKLNKTLVVEFTELNPMLDTADSKTVKNVLGLLEGVINSISNKK